MDTIAAVVFGGVAIWGFKHKSSSSGAKITGIRWWIGWTNSLAAVVKIVQDLIYSPWQFSCGDCHTSQKPAKARCLNTEWKAGLSSTFSTLALISFTPIWWIFAQADIQPPFNCCNSRLWVSGLFSTVATFCVTAMLYWATKSRILSNRNHEIKAADDWFKVNIP